MTGALRNRHLGYRPVPIPALMIDPRGKFIIFLHMQKCGGLTLQRLLRQKYGPSVAKRFARKVRRDAHGSSDLSQALAAYTAADRYVQGHFCYGVHRHLPAPYAYFTFLREPVSRLVSLYYYSHENPTAYYHKIARDVGIEQFLTKTSLVELDNGMVRFLAGDDEDLFINRTPFGACDERLYRRALQNIEDDFFLVGVLEAFDKSVLLLKHRLRWRTAYYLRRNERKRTPRPPLDPGLAAELRERNTWDLLLYEHARERLDVAFAEAYPSPDDALAAFQRRNATYNLSLPAYDAYDKLKAILAGNPLRPQ